MSHPDEQRSIDNRESRPRLYYELAAWWPVLSQPSDYAGEAALIRRILCEACERPPLTVLELGCGGGNNASHLKAHFKLTLTDLSPEMLKVSRRLNPECEHFQGDMRTIRLGRQFDAVYIHDAIAYMLTLDDLRCALETAFIHCRPGGAALLLPDFIRETYKPSTSHGGYDRPDRCMRYLEWCYDPDPNDATTVTDFAYILKDADGSVRVERDRHITGLFSREEWLNCLHQVGFQPKSFPEPCESDADRELFLGMRPSQS